MKKFGKILCLLISFLLILNGIYAETIEVDDLFAGYHSTQLFMAIGMQIFCSIHMSVFVLMPLAKFINKEKWAKIFGILFGIRVLILIIGDFIAPLPMAMIDFISIFLGAFIMFPLMTGIKNQYIDLDDFPDITDYEFASLKAGNIDNFKDLMISKVMEVEQAYCDFDYDRLKSLCTLDEYIKISNEAKSLQKKNYKAIITDFDVKESKVYFVNTSEKEQKASIVFSANVRNFIVDSEGKLKSGKNKSVKKIYVAGFSKDIIKEELIHNCPNCGASLDDFDSNVCKYCAGIIERKNKDWVLSDLNKVNSKK